MKNQKKIAVAKKDFVLKCERCEDSWCLVDEMKIKGWVRKNLCGGFNIKDGFYSSVILITTSTDLNLFPFGNFGNLDMVK